MADDDHNNVEVSVDQKTLVSHTRSDKIWVVLGRAPGATVGFEACGVSCDLGDTWYRP